jgi:hypothetical protein
LIRERVLVPAGGVTFSGAAPLIRERILAPAGGVTFGGTAPLIFIPAGGSAAQGVSRITVGSGRSARIS